jgi:epoxide hydrolase-like protein
MVPAHFARLTYRVIFRREIIVTAAMMVLALSSWSGPRVGLALTTATGETGTEIRPFHANVPEADLADLRRRLASTRWPDRETVADRSQGAELANLQELVRYWGTQYDWRKGEAKLNAFPQFKTRIDGVDIHFIRVKSHHPNASDHHRRLINAASQKTDQISVPVAITVFPEEIYRAP